MFSFFQTRYSDIKSLILTKCGFTDLILDNLTHGDNNSKKVTVGLAEEEDAAILVRKINGLFVDGRQIYVETVTKKQVGQFVTWNSKTHLTLYIICIFYNWYSFSDSLGHRVGHVNTSGSVGNIGSGNQFQYGWNFAPPHKKNIFHEFGSLSVMINANLYQIKLFIIFVY